MRHRAAHLLLATVLLLGSATTGGPARASAGGASVGGVDLRLVEQTPFIGPDGVFTLTLRAADPPEGAQIVFRQYGDVASAGRDRFAETIDGQGLGRLDRTIRLPLDQLPRDAAGNLVAAFPVLSDRQPPFGGLQLPGAGVYPLTATLETGDGADVAQLTTSIVKLPADDDPEAASLVVAVVVPLRAPPGLQPSGAAALPEPELDRLEGILAAVAAHPGAPVTLAATPETLQAIASTSGDAGARAIPATTELTAGPFVDLDLGAWVGEDLQPQLTREFLAGAATVGTTVGRPPDTGSWPVDPTTTTQTLGWLADTGVRRLAVPDDRLLPLDGAGRFGSLAPFDVVGPDGRRFRALAGDGALVAHLTDSDDPVRNAHTTIADLAMLYFQEPGIDRAVGLFLPDGGVDPSYLAALLRALDPATAATAAGTPPRPALRIDTLAGALDTVPPATGGIDTATAGDGPLVRTMTPGVAGDLGSYPTQLAFADTSLDGYRSMLPESEAWRVDPLVAFVLVSGSRSLDGRTRQDYLDATVARIDDAAASLTLPAQPRVTLTEETTEIFLVVDNAADYPLAATLTLSSDKLDFPDGDTRVVTLQPGGNRLPIAVRSRTSGAFPITVSLASPDGSIAIASTRFTVRSTAVSGVGLALTIGAGLFLLLWWVRHFRSARARPELVGSDEPGSRSTTSGD